MVILEYCSDKKYKDDESICLIGKGVMFDSGGLNLKTGDFSDMKTDMAGSAIVYGTIKLLEYFNIKSLIAFILNVLEFGISQTLVNSGCA